MFPYFQICWWVVTVCSAVVSLSDSQEREIVLISQTVCQAVRSESLGQREGPEDGTRGEKTIVPSVPFFVTTILAAYSDQASVLDTLDKPHKDNIT